MHILPYHDDFISFLKRGIWGYSVVLSWIYLRNLCMYFCTVLICIVNNKVWVCPSLHSYPSTHHFFPFLIIAVARGVKKYITKVQICISQIITEFKLLSITYWPFMHLLFQNVCSNLCIQKIFLLLWLNVWQKVPLNFKGSGKYGGWCSKSFIEWLFGTQWVKKQRWD